MSRLGRILDGVAVAVFAAGAGTYLWAWSTIRSVEAAARAEFGGEVEGAARTDGGPVFATVDRVAELDGWSQTGLWLMAAGAAIGLLAAAVAWRRRG